MSAYLEGILLSSVLEQAVAAHGGIERFRSIHDWHITADRKLEGAEPVEEVYDEYFLRENGVE